MKGGIAAGMVGCAVVVLAAMASQGGEPPEAARAREVAQTLLTESRTLLMKEMNAKGPAEALQACSAVALDMAKKHEADGWRIRRVSDRLRNPADAPDWYEAAMLARFAAAHAKGELRPESESLEFVNEAGKSYVRYMKPVTVPGALCLKCHGGAEDIDPEVQARIKRLYPGDRATGYKVGDLRGAVSVKIPVR